MKRIMWSKDNRNDHSNEIKYELNYVIKRQRNDHSNKIKYELNYVIKRH